MAGCSLFAEPSEPDGTYLLVRQNGHPLPWNYAEIHTPDGLPTGCWAAATEGELKLSEADGVFRTSAVFRSTCTGGVLWQAVARGSYSRTGTSMTFTVSDVGKVISYNGTSWRDSVQIDFLDPVDGSHWISQYERKR